MSLTDYSDLEQRIKDAPEPKILPVGSEVKARVVSVKSGISDKDEFDGYEWTMPLLDIPDEPLAREFSVFFWDLDESKLTEKQFAQSLAAFQKFAACFGIDYSRPFSWEDDVVGLEGWVILGIKKDDEYGDKNIIKKYVLRK